MYKDLTDEELLRQGIKHMTRRVELPHDLITTLKDRNLYEYLFPSGEDEVEDQ